MLQTQPKHSSPLVRTNHGTCQPSCTFVLLPIRMSANAAALGTSLRESCHKTLHGRFAKTAAIRRRCMGPAETTLHLFQVCQHFGSTASGIFFWGTPFCFQILDSEMSSLHEVAVKGNKQMPIYTRSQPKHADYMIIMLQYAFRVFTPVNSKLT